ncbi:MAG: hypothetical protein KDA87_06140 [Planctomycetales bacterium]|nr:hypothetical protein [Planctomycetales bacterium]
MIKRNFTTHASGNGIPPRKRKYATSKVAFLRSKLEDSLDAKSTSPTELTSSGLLVNSAGLVSAT